MLFHFISLVGGGQGPGPLFGCSLVGLIYFVGCDRVMMDCVGRLMEPGRWEVLFGGCLVVVGVSWGWLGQLSVRKREVGPRPLNYLQVEEEELQ